MPCERRYLEIYDTLMVSYGPMFLIRLRALELSNWTSPGRCASPHSAPSAATPTSSIPLWVLQYSGPPKSPAQIPLSRSPRLPAQTWANVIPAPTVPPTALRHCSLEQKKSFVQMNFRNRQMVHARALMLSKVEFDSLWDDVDLDNLQRVRQICGFSGSAPTKDGA